MVQVVSHFKISKTEIRFVKAIAEIMTFPDSVLSAQEKDRCLDRITQFRIQRPNYISAKFHEENRYLLINGKHTDFILIGLKDYIANHSEFFNFMNEGGKVGVIYDYSSPPEFEVSRTSAVSYDTIIKALTNTKAKDYESQMLISELTHSLQRSVDF